MTGLSLFSGIGGLDLAFEAAGGRVVVMCEIDPFCRAVLRKHWPDVPIYEDIKTLRGEQIGAVDVIFGGFPCQPFSVAGNQKGQDDDRYLWPEFSRLVGEIKPVWVVAENVPGILNIAADEVCADLERYGYEVGIWSYEAAAVGALHRRNRVFFVAHTGYGRQLRQKGEGEQQRGTDVIRAGEAMAARVFFVPHSRREVCERGAIQREICGEHGERTAIDAERPGGAYTSNSDSSRQLQQSWSLGQFREWSCDSSWWEFEPDVGRVANGIPHRVDRLRALGNAVVPAQCYPIFKAIMEADRALSA